MLFVNPLYLLFFLPIVTFLFYQIRNRTAALGFLALASFLFYAGFGQRFLLIFMSSIAINAAFALALLASRGRWRWRCFMAGMLFNIGYIFYFKYWWYLGSFGGAAFDVGSLAIPIGISFYTFQQMGFLFDLYADPGGTAKLLGYGKKPRQWAAALARFVAYVAFFPQLVIGPIVYLREYIAQINRPRFGRLRTQDLAIGCTLLILGFAKKGLADQLGLLSDPVFTKADEGLFFSRFDAWVAALAYFAQLYFDFSGYSDMALGAARLFGIRLPINFDSPLRAAGITDFYRRWHITLTRLIARFMFTPISLWGTRKAVGKRYRGWRFLALSSWLPLLINFQVIAIWHGLSPTFLLFGLIHGIWFIAESDRRAKKQWRRLTGRWSPTLRFYFGAALTFLPLMLTFALFRSSSLEAFVALCRKMFWQGAPGIHFEMAHLFLLGAFLIIWLLPNSNVLLRRFNPGFVTFANENRAVIALQWSPGLRWGLALSALFFVATWLVQYEIPFLYLGF